MAPPKTTAKTPTCFVALAKLSLLVSCLLAVEHSDAFTVLPAASVGHHQLLRTTTGIVPRTNFHHRKLEKNQHHHHLSTVTTTRVQPPLSMARGGDDEIQDTTDRILSCLPYLLPLMDGDRYGRYIFALLPPLGIADTILLGPFKLIYYGIPFAQFLAFLGLSFLSRNPNISRPVRFNMQQALLLDILLIFPSLFGRLPLFGMPSSISVESGTNFVFYVLVACVGYSLFSNLTGKLPNQIPVVSEASEMQVGPF